MHVVVDRLLGRLGRGLEQGADVDVEAQVGEGGGDHLLAAVVAVLAHLGDQDARAAALGRCEGLDQVAGMADAHGLPHLLGVDAGDRADLGDVAAPDLLQRRGDLADRGACPGRLDGQFEQVALAGLGAAGERVQGAAAARAGRARRAAAASFSICRARTAELSTLSTGIVLVLGRAGTC